MSFFKLINFIAFYKHIVLCLKLPYEKRELYKQDHAAANNGWFTFGTMLNFKQLGKMCHQEPKNLLQALNQHSVDAGLLEVDLEEMKVRRSPSKPLPENNQEYQLDQKLRTVMVSGFPGMPF